MPRPRRTQRADALGKGPTTRARIIDDAIRLVSVEGLAGLTIGRLAERTGMSKSGLFAHFESRESVELAVLDAAISRFRDDVVLPALREPRGEPRIRALVERWHAWSNDHASMPGGCLLLQASVELDDRPGPAQDLVADAMRQWYDTLRRAAAIAMDEGHFRGDLDPTLFAFQLQGIVLASHQAERLLRIPGSATRLRRAVDALIDWARPVTPPTARSRR
jgi:AcrR family transcriptional regulator